MKWTDYRSDEQLSADRSHRNNHSQKYIGHIFWTEQVINTYGWASNFCDKLENKNISTGKQWVQNKIAFSKYRFHICSKKKLPSSTYPVTILGLGFLVTDVQRFLKRLGRF